ncbi:MAG: class II fructose-bisphosphate aldolase [bacterium]
MISHIKDLARDAQKNSYALASFNIHNIESILGVVQAAERACSPVIIQVSESTIKYIGLKPITHLVSTIAKNVAPTVPIALHLDHGKSFESVIGCIRAGFTSVHIDASHLPLDENIALTKQVIAFARPKGVWVQGEVGAMVGGHGVTGGVIEIPKAKLEDVIKFAKETKIDTIAAAIGTAHGDYDNEEIDVSLLKAIKEKVKQPFVLHGGSGVDDSAVILAIKNGVNIINIGTDIKVAFCKTVIENAKKNPNETDPRNLLSPAIAAIEKVAYDKLKLFGSVSPNCIWPRIKT